MELNEALRGRFVKDFKLPITIIDENHYPYFKDLYDSFYGISKKEALMLDVLHGLKKDGIKSNSVDNLSEEKDMEHAYFMYSRSVGDKLKDILLSSKAYERMMKAELKRATSITKTNIYVPDNIDKRLISVDLNKANFNSFNIYGLSDELKISSFKDFISLATPYEYFNQSKIVRQVVFGNVNPDRQQAVQRVLMSEIALLLQKEGLSIASASSDELIVDPNGKDDVGILMVQDILSSLSEEKRFFRVEEFSFSKIVNDDTLNFFFKTSIDENMNVKEEFKNVPSIYFAQAFKYKFNLPLEERDLIFVHEGKLAKFFEPIVPAIKNNVENNFKMGKLF